MTIKEFLELVESDKLSWLNYCELIISSTGLIYIANPSHQEILVNMYCKKHKCTRQDLRSKCELYYNYYAFLLKETGNSVAVYYDIQLCYNKNINRFQRRVLNILSENELIKLNISSINL